MSLLKRQWERLQLSERRLINMARNAAPPTAALWAIQSTSLGKQFDIVGYLPIIVSILEPPMLPRVPFLKQMIFTCILNCLIACLCLLVAYCVMQARFHTTPPGGDINAYNSSASAVTGIWLFFTVWALHTFRAYYPQFTVSIVISTIFAEVTITIGAQLSSTSTHIKFVVQFLEMFFLAHGFCTFTNLFLFPESSRDVVFADVKNYLLRARNVLAAESRYVESLRQSPLLDVPKEDNASLTKRSLGREHNAEYKALKSHVSILSELHSKLRVDISQAKKDVGWSSISAADLDEILRDFRKLVLPLRGMTVLMSIFRRLCERRGWAIFEDSIGSANTLFSEKLSPEEDSLDREEWRAIYTDLSSTVNDINSMMEGALQHVSRALGVEGSTILNLGRRSSTATSQPDDGVFPGSANFVGHFERQIREFHARKGANLVRWLRRKGYAVDDDGDQILNALQSLPSDKQGLSERDRQQFFVILYMQNLFHGLSDAVLDLVRFSEKKTHVRKHLIFPSQRRLAKLAKNVLKDDNALHDTNDEVSGSSAVLTEGSYPPRNPKPQSSSAPSIFGSLIVTISDILGGPQSFFGFRVACAVMTVAIVALLRETQQWFFNQRCLWAVVFIPFSMAPSSGETMSMFVFRMIGTAIAVGVAIVNYYIVNGNPAGIIVFYFIFTFIENYFVIRFPQYGGVWRSSLITRAIITGFTLQIQTTHVPLAPATNTQHYPVYLIGPYRYACTAVGVFSAFIWTIFPRAISSRTLMRQKLGQAFYNLALYYSCMHSTVGFWAINSQGDLNDKSSPGYRLTKIRHKIFAQEVALLAAMQNHARFSRFEPSMNRAFPADLYDKILNEIDLLISYMNLVIHASTTEQHATSWFDKLSKLFNATDFTSSSITTLLSLLSASIRDKRPLPPGLTVPEPYQLTKQLQGVSKEILSLRHAGDAGYGALAVIEVTMTMIIESLEKLLQFVKELVGEIDFGVPQNNHEKSM